MSLEKDGVWEAGVWAPTVWADGVWHENTIYNVTGNRPTMSVATPSFSIQSKTGRFGPAFSVTKGYAPMSVFCDYGTTMDVTVTRPFHDLRHKWTVLKNDGTAVSWGSYSYGRGISKSQQVGPEACIEFSIPGSFIIEYEVDNGVTTRLFWQSITVVDPVNGGSGLPALTVHNFSTGTDFTGAPTGTNHGSWATGYDGAYATYGAANTMLCFRGGETFTASTAITMTANTQYFGGYTGFGAGLPKFTPVIVGTGINAITVSGTPSDIKLVDFELDGGGDGDIEAIFGSGYIQKLLMLRLYIHDCGGGIEIPLSFATAVHDQLAFIGGRLETFNATTSYTHGILFACTRGTILGSNLNDTNHGSAEHLARIQYLAEGVIRSNTFGVSKAGKEMLALRAPAATSAGTAGSYFPALGLIGQAAATRFVCVSDNIINTDVYAGIDVSPDNPDQQYYAQNCIFERNYYNQAATGGTGLIVRAVSDFTIRNEVVEGGVVTDTAIEITSSTTSGVSSGVDLYNLSAYMPFAGPGTRVISYSVGGQSNQRVKNCAGWAPNDASAEMVFGTPLGPDATPVSCTSNADLRAPTVRPFTGAAPAAIADYIPNPSGNPDIRGAGTTSVAVHVLDDYNGSARSGTIDMGAIEV